MKELNSLIPYKDGEISIQGSEFHYCHPKNDKGPYSAFEVAVFDKSGNRVKEDLFKEDADDKNVPDPVYGWVTVSTLVRALKKDGYNELNIIGILERVGN